MAASDNLIYVPSLDKAFHVTKNALFKITFQGSFWNGDNDVNYYYQIMVNDYLIIGNSLVRNNNKQVHGDGGVAYVQHTATASITVTRIAMVFLPPGTYTFNIGVRAEMASGSVARGIVMYELTQFVDNNDDLGDYKLAILPN
ncbi:unnamed protein product [Rotaria sp. Silwood2]|nr:unnamed protein product [Rotaria sp. Silwood2]